MHFSSCVLVEVSYEIHKTRQYTTKQNVAIKRVCCITWFNSSIHRCSLWCCLLRHFWHCMKPPPPLFLDASANSYCFRVYRKVVEPMSYLLRWKKKSLLSKFSIWLLRNMMSLPWFKHYHCPVYRIQVSCGKVSIFHSMCVRTSNVAVPVVLLYTLLAHSISVAPKI